MAPSLLWCAIDREGEVALAFLAAIGVTVLLAGLLFVVSRHAREDFQAQEGFVTVGLCWVFMSLVGCLPFYFTREIPQFVDAFFEAVSGFTTTGASIVADVEGLSRAVVYWRSFTHWLGGMGMLVFALAVVPASKTGSGRLYLMRAESRPQRGQIYATAAADGGHFIWYLHAFNSGVCGVSFSGGHALVRQPVYSLWNCGYGRLWY